VRLVFLVALLAGLAACHGPRSDSTYATQLPGDVRASYGVFEQRCSKCHSLARALDSGIDDDARWALYVERMRRQPSSGISVADVKPILAFLHYYAAERRRRAVGGSR
jgi:hypothetical protein